jgi:hypothetical protein
MNARIWQQNGLQTHQLCGLLAFYIAGIKKTIRSPFFGFAPIDNHFAGYLHPFN